MTVEDRLKRSIRVQIIEFGKWMFLGKWEGCKYRRTKVMSKIKIRIPRKSQGLPIYS